MCTELDKIDIIKVANTVNILTRAGTPHATFDAV